jgi:MscS family membrane protein
MNISEIITWFGDKGWILQTFLIVLVSLILHYIETRIYKRVLPRLQKTPTFWDETLVYAVHKPLGALIWILGISFAAQIVGLHAKDKVVFDFLGTVRELAILLILVWFLIRFISYAEQKIIAKNTIDKTTVHALCQLFRAAVLITAILIGLQIFGIPISAVLAFGGMGGLAAGFAAKDMLANFFGGLMIYLDRPFSVGDWIKSPDKEIEGTVEHIGWRLTRIRTFDKRPLFIPNGVFSTISVENPSRMTNRRIKAIINLRYDDATKIAVILSDIEKMLRKHPGIDTKQTLMVNLVECASWSLNFMLYAFTKTTKWVEFQAIQQDVFLKVLEIVAAHDAECAFPTSTIHIPEPIEVIK